MLERKRKKKRKARLLLCVYVQVWSRKKNEKKKKKKKKGFFRRSRGAAPRFFVCFFWISLTAVRSLSVSPHLFRHPRFTSRCLQAAWSAMGRNGDTFLLYFLSIFCFWAQRSLLARNTETKAAGFGGCVFFLRSSKGIELRACPPFVSGRQSTSGIL